MKKLISLLLAVLLCTGFACAESLNLSGVEATIPATTVDIPAFELADEAMATTMHMVDMTDSTITVTCTAENMRVAFDFAAAGNGYICLTQNMTASYQAYKRFLYPDQVNTMLVENSAYLYIIDLYTDDWFMVRIAGGDDLTSYVGYLGNWSTADVEYVAELYGCQGPYNYYNGNPWIRHMAGCYISILNGQLVIVNCSETITDEDLSYFLNSLSIGPAW